ncbi:hypothetical protein [Rubritalea tangerina]|uniref:hypothetical protein n=1 Tax=Rubritalea tangerina TaxID=430798 RepID=UPI0036150F3B
MESQHCAAVREVRRQKKVREKSLPCTTQGIFIPTCKPKSSIATFYAFDSSSPTATQLNHTTKDSAASYPQTPPTMLTFSQKPLLYNAIYHNLTRYESHSPQ